MEGDFPTVAIGAKIVVPSSHLVPPDV